MKQALKEVKKISKKPNKGSEAANAVISILKNGPKKSKNSPKNKSYSKNL